MKKIITFLFLAVPVVCFASVEPKVQEAINPDLKVLKKEGCLVNPKSLKTYFSKNMESLLVSIPYEGCGGGNNWGAVTKIYSNYKNGKWGKNKTVNTTGLNSVKLQGEDSFVITSTEYAENDPHCCPSINKKTIINP